MDDAQAPLLTCADGGPPATDVDGGAELGLVRLLDLDDGTPLFALRVTATARGRGVGEAGRVYDSVGYAILRRDWAAGTTTPVNWADG